MTALLLQTCLIVCILLLSCAAQEDGYATAKHDDGDIQLLLRRQGFLKNVDGDWGRGSQGAFDKWAKENYGDAYNGQDRHHEMFLKHYGIPKAYLLGLFSPRRHSQFAKIPSQLCKGSACAHFLRKEALAGFSRMQAAAVADGVDLRIMSGCRNFNRQKGIWEKKWTGGRLVQGMNLAETIRDHADRAEKILLYSSMPGTSRHHWGADIDINSVSPSYWSTSRTGIAEFAWLKANAHKFGFCLPYSRNRNKGYQPEDWHWSYMPVSQGLLKDYLREITYDDIKGFKGSDAAKDVDAIGTYVSGINPTCQESAWGENE